MGARIDHLYSKIAALEDALKRPRGSEPTVAAALDPPESGSSETHGEEVARLSQSVHALHPGVSQTVIDELDHDIDLLMKFIDGPNSAPPAH